MTPAETGIAELFAQGYSPELIAQSRGVAVVTVRTQLKAIMAKLGVGRQVDLLLRLGQL